MARKTLYKGASVSVLLVLVVCISHTGRLLGVDHTPVVQEKGIRNISSSVPETAWRSRTLLADKKECREIHLISGADNKCKFVKETEDCQNNDGFFDYTDFVYCKLGKAVPGGMTVLVLWWLFCFIGLAVCADDFFCPSLVVISKTLRLSPNVAGVTFLAFGNGAPDFFSAITALGNNSGDAGLGIGGLFGAGMFVTTVVVGTISVVKPFKATERPFLRDVIFYMGTVYWVFYVLYREKMYLFDTIGIVSIYVIYVITVVVSGMVYKRIKEAKENKKGSGVVLQQTTLMRQQSQEISAVVVAGNVNIAFEPDALTETPNGRPRLKREDSLANIGVDAVILNGTATDIEKEKEAMEKIGEEEEEEEEEGEPLSWWRMLLNGINPINVEEWPDMPWYSKAYEIFKSPIMLAINLTCPVVNYDDEELDNWNKYLQCLQLLLGPMVCIFLIKGGFASIKGGFHLWMLMLIIGLAFALLVFFTSNAEEKPKYHSGFGYLGFAISLIWIYVIANEIVALLETFGVVFNISNAILGLTLLAWGNSIGDWISNVVMARQGFARMGFAACFGAPLFNLCLGFGIPLMVQILKSNTGYAVLKLTPVTVVLAGFLLASLVSSIVLLPLLKFKVNRIYGLYLLILYIAFLVTALLTETKVILKDFKK